jgi:hypothetical protein
VLKIDGLPVPGGMSTAIVQHQWRLISAGATGITATDLMNTDQQVVMIPTDGLSSGTFTLEYQFFEDYGSGAIVSSDPKIIEVALNNVGGGNFFWDGN